MTNNDTDNNLRKKRKALVKSLIEEADKKLSGGYKNFSSKFAEDYLILGPSLASLDASVTLRAISCMEAEQAKRFIEQKQPLKLNDSAEVAYLEMALNAVSYMNPEQAKRFAETHPVDLELISDKDFAFKKGVYRFSLSENSSVEIAYPCLLMVAMRHKDLSLPVGREWIQNGLSLPKHSLDVSMNMGIIASKHFGIGKEESAKYELYGLLHDIGKLEVEVEYLGSEKPLDNIGWKSIKRHPCYGETIISMLVRHTATEYSREILINASKSVRWHHENFDGSGYPDGIKGKDIPLHARVLRIADFWSAARANRSYSPSMPAEVAIEEGKRCSGQPYNEKVLRDYQERVNKRYDRWKKGKEMQFDPEICAGGKIFELLAEETQKAA